MAVVMNSRQWRKAYMIEFLKNDNEVEDVFTFSVPPESESLEFPQRITETTTFGGVVFDDYGNDTVKIRLTGSTINEERKLIYRGNTKLPDYLTGEKEIFKLQELLEKWGSLDNPNFASKKIYLYDLSKMNLLQAFTGSPTRNYWRVVNKGLKIKRAKDKPFTFNYELELIGIVDKSHTPLPLFDGGFGAFLDGLQKAVEDIKMVMEMIEAVADTIDTLTQQIVDVRKFAEKLGNGDTLHNFEAVTRIFPVGRHLYNATKAILSTVSKIEYLLEGEDKKDELVYPINQIADMACRLVALAKEKQVNVENVVYIDNDGNDAMANVYDYKTVKTTTAKTFDKLAQDEYGDPSLWSLLAYYNKIQNEHTVEAGTTLKIPVLTIQDQNLNNRIYAPPELQDRYGNDIALTDSGGFMVNMGDFDVVKGPQNLHQAVGNRLTTASGKRIRIGTYGIRNSIGDTMAANGYLIGSIEQTIKEDPRIASVDEIEFKGIGDKLYITVTYTDINGNKDTYMGEI